MSFSFKCVRGWAVAASLAVAGAGGVVGVSSVMAEGPGASAAPGTPAASGAAGGATEHKMPEIKSHPALDALKALVGTWATEKPMAEGHMAGQTLTTTFRVTAGGSAVEEVMFPGGDHEMVNLYTTDGQAVTLTHYCAMGNQPTMKATSVADGVIRFEFVGGGNIASRDAPHMDSLEITIKGNHLTEKWAMYAEGKVVGYETIEFVKK